MRLGKAAAAVCAAVLLAGCGGDDAQPAIEGVSSEGQVEATVGPSPDSDEERFGKGWTTYAPLPDATP